MYRIAGPDVIDALSQLSRLSQMIALCGGQNFSYESDFIRRRIAGNVEALKVFCEAAELTVSRASALQLAECLGEVTQRPDVNSETRIEAPEASRIANYANQAVERIRDELGNRVVLVLPDEQSQNYTQPAPPFGSDVANKIPAASGDISEAAKCLALSRFPASVFHNMRAMEAAVRAMGKALGSANTDKVWGRLLSEAKAKAESLPKGTAQEIETRNRWLEVHAMLYSVKESMRNEIMHPTEAIYSEARAEQIFNACKGFMQSLAAVLN